MDKDQILKTFGAVWDAAGVRGFFKEGYAFHRLLGPFGPDFTGSTFVAKTSTLKERAGNTPLNKEFEPQHLFPPSVYVGIEGMWGGYTLNSWGLSGPGLHPLFARAVWQTMEEPFMLSFMPAPGDKETQFAEVKDAAKTFAYFLRSFQTKVAIQLNLSCPNTETSTAAIVREGVHYLEVMEDLGVPIIPKISVDMPLVAVAEIAKHRACAALCVTNALKFGSLPDRINWEKLYGKKSPLEKLGGGGLSGAPLLPLCAEYVTRLRALGVTKHINAGGGILSAQDADLLREAGADSLFLGSVAMLRPWRVQPIINHINNSSLTA